jgi:hypothetical protein
MATAQGRTPVEIAPFIGYRFGGRAYGTYAGHNQTIDTSRSEGATVDVSFAHPPDAFELLYSR